MWCKPRRMDRVNYARRTRVDYSEPSYTGRRDQKSFLPLDEVTKVVIGVTSDVPYAIGDSANDQLLFSLVTQRRVLTLQASTSEECEFYASAWNYYLSYNYSTANMGTVILQ